MSLETASFSEFEYHENIVSESEIWELEHFKVDQKFIQVVDFEDPNADRIESILADKDLKILRVRNCSDFKAVSDRFLEWNIGSASKLFVFVLEFLEKLEAPSELELKNFVNVFKNNRPVILQFNYLNRKEVFVKNHIETEFESLSMDEASLLSDRALIEILELYGKYEGDILAIELCQISESVELYDRVAASALCLRIINLVDGGCRRILPYLIDSWLLESHDMETHFAYNDHPFDYLDYLETSIASDNPFPKDFYVDRTKISGKFGLLLDQRQQLHESIAEGNSAAVSRMLAEMKERSPLVHAFNQNNESALATSLKNFNADVYGCLLQNNLKFCEKCVQLMKELPETARQVIKDKNQDFFKPVKSVSGNHQLVSATFLATGHYNHEVLSKKIDKLFWELETYPEVSELLRIAKANDGLKIVFDFNHSHVGMMSPEHLSYFVFVGMHSDQFITQYIYISGKRDDLKIMDTLGHELTHLTMHLLYKNYARPFCLNDTKREQEFDEVIEECRLVYKSMATVKTQAINQTLTFYEEYELSSELIAIVPELIVQYSKDDLEEIKAAYPKLFAYYFLYIPFDINKACNE